jgi:hypothetical protein
MRNSMAALVGVLGTSAWPGTALASSGPTCSAQVITRRAGRRKQAASEPGAVTDRRLAGGPELLPLARPQALAPPRVVVRLRVLLRLRVLARHQRRVEPLSTSTSPPACRPPGAWDRRFAIGMGPGRAGLAWLRPDDYWFGWLGQGCACSPVAWDHLGVGVVVFSVGHSPVVRWVGRDGKGVPGRAERSEPLRSCATQRRLCCPAGKAATGAWLSLREGRGCGGGAPAIWRGG